MSHTRIGRALVVCALAALGLGGCSDPELTITTDSLEAGLTETLRERGRLPEKVDCPSEVKAEMAQRTECVMTEKGERFHVAVVVTSIYDGKAEYDIEVDAKPMR